MTSIPDFYAERSIFITGATGFMGKVLVEKILRSCSAVKNLYLLVRPKKGKDPQTRVDQLLKSRLFEKLRSSRPEVLDKVHAIAGDIIEPGLGISAEDLKILTSEVSVVFHSAATVKFDEVLKLSVQMNVKGTKELLGLVKKWTKLEAFVHVSTAYCNCDKTEIKESIYPPPIAPKKILDAIEWMDDEVLEALSPKLVQPRPNTYTFTKAIAEYLMIEEGEGIPIAVVRPSIVGCSLHEPCAGWVDNFNGPSGLLVAIGKGVLRIMKGNTDCTADIVPVDIATNLMIAAAWYTAIERPEQVKVFNCTTGQLNNVTWGTLERASYDNLMKNPLENIVRIPSPHFTLNSVWYHLNIWLDHHLPAWLMDLQCRLMGKKPIFTKLQTQIWKSVSCLEYFTSREWNFHNHNVIALNEKVTPEDRKEFNFDPRTIHWPTYFENYCIGVKQYALKEDLKDMPAARLWVQKYFHFQTTEDKQTGECVHSLGGRATSGDKGKSSTDLFLLHHRLGCQDLKQTASYSQVMREAA